MKIRDVLSKIIWCTVILIWMVLIMPLFFIMASMVGLAVMLEEKKKNEI